MLFKIVYLIVLAVTGFLSLYRGLMLLFGTGEAAKRIRLALEKKGKDSRRFLKLRGILEQLFGVALLVASVTPLFTDSAAVLGVLLAVIVVLLVLGMLLDREITRA